MVGGEQKLETTATSPTCPTGDLSVQQRLETSTAGRWLLRALLALTVTAVVVWNFPGSGIRTGVLPVVDRYINATGLTQAWNLFAPNPTDHSTELTARIEYADGGSQRWQPPRGGDIVGGYRTYHWAVFVDRLGSEGWQYLREPFARWLARTQSQEGRRPVRVELISRRAFNLPPGSDGSLPSWEETTLYTLDLSEESRR